MSTHILGFLDIDKTMSALVGGKGANLGELMRIAGVQVPRGFCVTTDVFKAVVDGNAALGPLLDQLAALKPENRKSIAETSAKVRAAIEAAPLPHGIANEIARHLGLLGEQIAYAVRSSATAEDLPTASFAGQQDTYLNITGKAAILFHIRKCWASLFTERAVVYRLQNGFGHRKVFLSVVVQRMVFPQAAGILFTADPVSGNRKVLSVDAGFGLGEAMVSGLVNADHYKVRDGKMSEKRIAVKKLAVYARKDGGTEQRAVAPELATGQVLTDSQILALAGIGRKIAQHFGHPQDIEWCLADGTFYIVQSRPITTLFPVPGIADGENHVYVSVGHNQMMTDAMKPLGIAFFRLTTHASMQVAGGRLFVDITPHLASPDSRNKLLTTFGHGDLLIKDAVMTVVKRKGFIKPAATVKGPSPGYVDKSLSWSYLAKFEDNPEIVPGLIKANEISVATLQQRIRQQSGTGLFDFILEDFTELKKTVFDPRSWEVIKIALYASAWINKRMLKWLGEKNVADVLSQSVPHNITSEMGLALLDVADVIRPYPEVIAYLQQVKGEDFLDDIAGLKGGQAARDAIVAYLDKYGMRCVGEIDITKTRWAEKPALLVPLILSNIKNFAPGAGKLRFEQGVQEAQKNAHALLDKLLELPDGKRKARETRRMIGLLRRFMGYREYPKYWIINRYFIYKQALLKEAELLVAAGIIREKEDAFYLSFEEFREAVRTKKVDEAIIHQRKDEYRVYEKLTPPRVITSDGEIIAGAYKRENIPAGAIAGLAVSSGVIEGRARVILDMEDAEIEDGDILVTAYTDPSWTPLFVSIKGLVTEVGGLMSHGSVIAREYGLPAVVGVENVTRLIKDGQRIRVNGTDGYVEIPDM